MDFARSRILVTGGAGFIGSALVWELNRRGCERIVVADFLEKAAKWNNLKPLRFESTVEAGELLARLKAGSLGKFDLVLHMGACTSTTEMNREYLTRNNFEYTRDLAIWAQEKKNRFVYASSAATYGDGSAGMDDRETQLEKFRPLNPYGDSKQQFDLYAKQQGLLDSIVGLKYFNVFGPNEGHKGEMRSLVNKAYGQILETGKIRLFKSYRPDFKDGEQKRDFLYIKDAVKMSLHLAANPKANGLFNIGSGEAHTWIELANAVFEAMGRPPKIEFIEMPEAIRPNYQYFTKAEIKKLRDAGYKDKVTPLREAISDYVKNYLMKNETLSLSRK